MYSLWVIVSSTIRSLWFSLRPTKHACTMHLKVHVYSSVWEFMEINQLNDAKKLLLWVFHMFSCKQNLFTVLENKNMAKLNILITNTNTLLKFSVPLMSYDNITVFPSPVLLCVYESLCFTVYVSFNQFLTNIRQLNIPSFFFDKKTVLQNCQTHYVKFLFPFTVVSFTNLRFTGLHRLKRKSFFFRHSQTQPFKTTDILVQEFLQAKLITTALRTMKHFISFYQYRKFFLKN